MSTPNPKTFFTLTDENTQVCNSRSTRMTKKQALGRARYRLTHPTFGNHGIFMMKAVSYLYINERGDLVKVDLDKGGEFMTQPDLAFQPYSSPKPEEQIGHDLSIHTNPDARAWAKFFIETMTQQRPIVLDEELMISWFANAMMAMHDHLKRKEPPAFTKLEGDLDRSEIFGFKEGDPVILFDRYRFAVPLKAVVARTGPECEPKGDGVKVYLISGHGNAKPGDEVWVCKQQLRHDLSAQAVLDTLKKDDVVRGEKRAHIFKKYQDDEPPYSAEELHRDSTAHRRILTHYRSQMVPVTLGYVEVRVHRDLTNTVHIQFGATLGVSDFKLIETTVNRLREEILYEKRSPVQEFWDQVPAQFQYLAMDRDGKWWVYGNEPECKPGNGVWTDRDTVKVFADGKVQPRSLGHLQLKSPLNPNAFACWKDTLTHRS